MLVLLMLFLLLALALLGPKRVRADVITRSDAAALIPDEDARQILQSAPASSVALSLFQRAPNMSRGTRTMAALTALPYAYFVNGDTGLKSTSKQAWGNKTLTAEEIAVIVPIPQAVLADSTYDIWGEVKPRLVSAFGKVLDRAIFFGTNKPASWPTAIVTDAIAKGNSLSLAGGIGADLVDKIGDEGGLMALVEADGFDVSGFVGARTMKAKFRGLRDANGGLLFNPSLQAGTPGTLYGEPILYPEHKDWLAATALMVAGDFSMGMIAIRQDIEYLIGREATIHDQNGVPIYNLFQQDMVALRATFRVAFQTGNFLNDYNEEIVNPYPWSVLTP